jgi:hypothetical protein
MAPMWEAMGGPLLPKFAGAFAEQLKAEIEKTVGIGAPPTIATPSLWEIVWQGLQRFCRAPFGSALR